MLRRTRIHQTAIAATLACALTGPAGTALAQDLRSLDARKAAPTSSLAGTTSPKQDLRSPDARDAAIPRRKAINAPGATAVDSATRPAPRALPDPPTWPVDPEPITPASAVEATGDDGGGVDWAPIGIGIAGGLLAVGGIAALAGRRRWQRLRVAA